MANLTQIIGGQPYYSATAGNEKNNLLDFWKGTQAQYNALKKTSAVFKATRYIQEENLLSPLKDFIDIQSCKIIS